MVGVDGGGVGVGGEQVLLNVTDGKGQEWMVVGFLMGSAVRSGEMSERRRIRELPAPLSVTAIRVVVE